MSNTDIVKLYDMLDAITKIEKYYTLSPADELRWNMMLRQMQIIGEAAGKLSGEIKERAGDVPWAQIVATRHILVHAYDGIDNARIALTLQRDIHPLKSTIEKLLKTLDPNEEFK